MPDVGTLESREASQTGAIQVAALDHLVLRVADLDRAIKFYGDVLGCHVERRLDEPKLVQLRAGASMIDLVPAAARGRRGRQDATWTISRCASAPSTSRHWRRIYNDTASPLVKSGGATAPKATAPRFTSPTPTATSSSSRVRRKEPNSRSSR